MRRWLGILLSLHLVQPLGADQPDEIDQALALLRQRVVSNRARTTAALVGLGASAALAGSLFIEPMVSHVERHGWPRGLRSRLATGMPMVIVVGGGALMTAGIIQFFYPSLVRARPAEAYRSRLGLMSFMDLTFEQQSRLAHADPELGRYLVDMVDVLERENKMPAPPVIIY